MARRSAPEVNAGSMADIAFLLLIFFLVTTDIAVDSGLSRKLPPIDDNPEQEQVVKKEKNIFALNVNSKNALFLKSGGEEKRIELNELRELAVNFIDNGGGKGDDACRRCQGAKNPKSSDNFQTAVISLANDRLAEYKTYIAVQNEIIAAYNQIRNREFRREYPKSGMNFVEATEKYQDPQTKKAEKADLKEKLETIKLLVPQFFSEAETKNK
ncbi:biopolymer transporter ExbD [uncultured Lacinutrix sp.]|uniref:ExbD/TolR family protein n=1 Tax=uncultured Lacinutrix sp. TaxID=574032 RepID=UPI0026288466|nr:biopolymer transporter ExbD [uncultured Lacinutrix sp.]